MPDHHDLAHHDLAHHDLVGVGLGPFNLGLAALSEPLDGLDAVFFDQAPSFSWHPGLLLDDTTLQVPFLADLVTLADPTSPFSFLNYLRDRGRLLRFYFYEELLIARKEFDAYCRWVAEQLDSCRFGHRVSRVHHTRTSTSTHNQGDGDGHSGAPWTVEVEGPHGLEVHTADHVVLGVGTRPRVPACIAEHLGDHVTHTSGFLPRRRALVDAEHVTVIGSGQSAAEAMLDLLRARGDADPLDWFTRAEGFFPMEYSKLGLEHFTPEYTAHFHGLAAATRDDLRSRQDLLYKGISSSTSAAIYDELYRRSIEGDDLPVTYAAACELVDVAVDDRSDAPSGSRYRLTYRHLHDGTTFERDTDAIVAGTGYEPAPLPIDDPSILAVDHAGRPVIERDYRVRLRDGSPSTLFVQNAELHTHGVGAPDLGLGAHRNSVILNAVTGREAYPVHDRNVFQTFGVPTAKEPA